MSGRAALDGLSIKGRPLRVRFAPQLSVWRGRLLEAQERGRPVHAAAFLHRRLIVLDGELLNQQGELERILAHELLHFAWLRLGNALRKSWENLLAGELSRRARGELGWSAQWRKAELKPDDTRLRTRRWREYVCESFADTGAWLWGGERPHAEITLGARFRAARKRWFVCTLAGRQIPI